MIWPLWFKSVTKNPFQSPVLCHVISYPDMEMSAGKTWQRLLSNLLCFMFYHCLLNNTLVSLDRSPSHNYEKTRFYCKFTPGERLNQERILEKYWSRLIMHKEWRQNDEVLNNLRWAYSNIDTVFNFFNDSHFKLFGYSKTCQICNYSTPQHISYCNG